MGACSPVGEVAGPRNPAESPPSFPTGELPLVPDGQKFTELPPATASPHLSGTALFGRFRLGPAVRSMLPPQPHCSDSRPRPITAAHG